jgi:hypothetical protein
VSSLPLDRLPLPPPQPSLHGACQEILRSRDWTKRALAVPLSCHKSFFSILLILLLFIFLFLCRYPGAGIHMSSTIYVPPPPFLLGFARINFFDRKKNFV